MLKSYSLIILYLSIATLSSFRIKSDMINIYSYKDISYKEINRLANEAVCEFNKNTKYYFEIKEVKSILVKYNYKGYLMFLNLIKHNCLFLKNNIFSVQTVNPIHKLVSGRNLFTIQSNSTKCNYSKKNINCVLLYHNKKLLHAKFDNIQNCKYYD